MPIIPVLAGRSGIVPGAEAVSLTAMKAMQPLLVHRPIKAGAMGAGAQANDKDS